MRKTFWLSLMLLVSTISIADQSYTRQKKEISFTGCGFPTGSCVSPPESAWLENSE